MKRKIVWHDAAKEKPRPHSWILVSTKNPKSIAPVLALDSDILEADKKGTFKIWAYAEDVLPFKLEN